MIEFRPGRLAMPILNARESTEDFPVSGVRIWGWADQEEAVGRIIDRLPTRAAGQSTTPIPEAFCSSPHYKIPQSQIGDIAI